MCFYAVIIAEVVSLCKHTGAKKLLLYNKTLFKLLVVKKTQTQSCNSLLKMFLQLATFVIAFTFALGEDPIVKTSTGTFQGQVVGVPDSTTKVFEFLSIPL